MPMITLQFAAAQADDRLRADLAAIASRLAADVLHKDPAVTAVVVEQIDPANWFCGGRSLAAVGLAAVWLDIRIHGTNTKDDKAAFVAAAFHEFGERLGSMHEESYIYVHEVRADSYGYGGLTQERRYILGRLAPQAARRPPLPAV